MRLSRFFLPTLKETPAEATIPSHQLMLRAGMIAQSGSGIYTWLPLGLRVLKKIETIIREEQNRAGCLEVLMPTIQPMDLWVESGRHASYGDELLRFTDRNEREMCYSPTNEEMITDIFRRYVKSYRDLPMNLYQIQWKFRDEMRPRFGVMRKREFLMKDNYSFDIDKEGALRSYKNMFDCYLRTFSRMGVLAIPVKAESGAIGGDLSQEFNIIAETGENTLYYHKDLETLSASSSSTGIDIATNNLSKLTSLYAATEEKHDPSTCPVPEDDLMVKRGIEVGHIFNFGTKYSLPMGACVHGPDGNLIPVEMGSYGIGVSRLVGAIVEACHDEKGILWPSPVAPFQVGLILVATKDETAITLAEGLYNDLLAAGMEVLFDDRELRAGNKFADMDLIGLPWQVIIGKEAVNGKVELKSRKTGETALVDRGDALSRILDKILPRKA